PADEDARMELIIFRVTAVVTIVVAAILSLALKNENIAYLTALAFGIAAATNFPILILAIYWKNLTVKGAIFGGVAGLFSSLFLLILGPTVWVQLLGNSSPIFPSDYSTLISVPIAFIVAYIVSKLDGDLSVKNS
ncbi:MAG: cation acetate symporter, partial [Porticoccaceae bacterium]|nr:cation acetate symporter [Porticoccaceae bacterium]